MNKFKKPPIKKDILESEIKVWEKTIDVQMHFNELQMKIRNFSVLLISAFVGAAGIALKDRLTIDYIFWGINFHGNLSSVFFGAAAIAWLAFFFMDHHWYYPLLIGAVKHGISIEDSLKEKIPLIGLTTKIRDESPQELLKITLRSKDKSFVFYISIFALLLIVAVGSNWVPAVESSSKATAGTTTSSVTSSHQKANVSASTVTTTKPREAPNSNVNNKTTSNVNFAGKSAKTPEAFTNSKLATCDPNTSTCKQDHQ